MRPIAVSVNVRHSKSIFTMFSLARTVHTLSFITQQENP